MAHQTEDPRVAKARGITAQARVRQQSAVNIGTPASPEPLRAKAAPFSWATSFPSSAQGEQKPADRARAGRASGASPRLPPALIVDRMPVEAASDKIASGDTAGAAQRRGAKRLARGRPLETSLFRHNARVLRQRKAFLGQNNDGAILQRAAQPAAQLMYGRTAGRIRAGISTGGQLLRSTRNHVQR